MVFKREIRYMVAKNRDIEAALSDEERQVMAHLLGKVSDHRSAMGKPPLQCVVVEQDWSNYEETWAAVERIDGGNENTVEDVLTEMAENARENGHQLHCDALQDAIQRLYDDGFFKHKYYCECDGGCGNSYQTVLPDSACLECGKGIMRAQDVEPWG